MQVQSRQKVAVCQVDVLLTAQMFLVSGKSSKAVRRADPLISDYGKAEGQREEKLCSVSQSIYIHKPDSEYPLTPTKSHHI